VVEPVRGAAIYGLVGHGELTGWWWGQHLCSMLPHGRSCES
jgi:hypothetical protein